jgi:hypothetical protein
MRSAPAVRTATASSYRHFDDFPLLGRGQFRRGRFQIQINGLPDVLQCFFAGVALRPTAFQRRAMCDIVTVFASLNDDFQIHSGNIILCLAAFKQRLEGNSHLSLQVTTGQTRPNGLAIRRRSRVPERRFRGKNAPHPGPLPATQGEGAMPAKAHLRLNQCSTFLLSVPSVVNWSSGLLM